MKRAVLFDFDGVMADTFRYNFEAWQHVLAPLGIRLQPREVYLHEGQPVRGVLGGLLQSHGRTLSEAELRHLIDEKQRFFREHQRARPLPGVVVFLQEVKRRGFKTALVTGTTRQNVETVLSPEALALFDTLVTEGATKHGKPHPDPYLEAARRLRVAPEECVVIENAPLGIRAAKRAGMTCVAITSSLPAEDLQEADFIFRDIPDVQKHFDRIYRL
ncbi:MAG: HAD family phosphatase [candidate division KSB1 bacterium]|nr:HAD family phosphatase [candidate division KSB1 bacterium]